MKHLLHLLLASFVALSATNAIAQITVKHSWLRATVPQQQATGAFMQITSSQDARLVDARSPAAARVEIHEMTLQDNIMKMRQVPGLDLPAGKPVELKPGGYHLMLFGLKHALTEGESVPVTLTVEGKDRQRESVELQVPVRAINGAAMSGRH